MAPFKPLIKSLLTRISTWIPDERGKTWQVLNSNILNTGLIAIGIYFMSTHYQQQAQQDERNKSISAQLRRLDYELHSRSVEWQRSLKSIIDRFPQLTNKDIAEKLQQTINTTDESSRDGLPEYRNTHISALMSQIMWISKDSTNPMIIYKFREAEESINKWNHTKDLIESYSAQPDTFSSNTLRNTLIRLTQFEGPLANWLMSEPSKIESKITLDQKSLDEEQMAGTPWTTFLGLFVLGALCTIFSQHLWNRSRNQQPRGRPSETVDQAHVNLPSGTSQSPLN